MSDLLRALHELDSSHEEKLHAVYMERIKLEKELRGELAREISKNKRLEKKLAKLHEAVHSLRELISAERTVRTVRAMVRRGDRRKRNPSQLLRHL
jgi:hypothetical protein